MANLLYVPLYKTTTLNVAGGIDASQTSGIVLENVTGVDTTKPGMICVNWSSDLDTSTAEFIEYTSISSKTLVGAVRGREGVSAKAHTNKVTVAFVISKAHINRINDQLTGEDATLFTNLKATGAEINTGTEDAKIVTPKAIEDSKVLMSDKTWDGWIEASGTWTYASATTITVPSGAASLYKTGDKIKLTQTTVKYFYIVRVQDTLLTVTGGSDYTVADAAITSPYYSHTNNPIGFPNGFALPTPTWSTSGTPFTNDPTFNGQIWMEGSKVIIRFGGRTNATSGGTGNFIMTFAAGILPPINGEGAGTCGRVGSTSVLGFTWCQSGIDHVIKFANSDGTEIAGNNHYFYGGIWYDCTTGV